MSLARASAVEPGARPSLPARGRWRCRRAAGRDADPLRAACRGLRRPPPRCRSRGCSPRNLRHVVGRRVWCLLIRVTTVSLWTTCGRIASAGIPATRRNLTTASLSRRSRARLQPGSTRSRPRSATTATKFELIGFRAEPVMTIVSWRAARRGSSRRRCARSDPAIAIRGRPRKSWEGHGDARDGASRERSCGPVQDRFRRGSRAALSRG